MECVNDAHTLDMGLMWEGRTGEMISYVVHLGYAEVFLFLLLTHRVVTCSPYPLPAREVQLGLSRRTPAHVQQT